MGKTGTSWIYQLKKEELISESEIRQLDTSGGVDELRKGLSEFIKEYEASGTSNTEIKSPNPLQSNSLLGIDNLQKQLSEMDKEGDTTRTEIDNFRPTPRNHLPSTEEILRQRMNQPQAQPQNPAPPLHFPAPPQGPSDADVLEIVRKWNVHFDGGNDALEFLKNSPLYIMSPSIDSPEPYRTNFEAEH